MSLEFKLPKTKKQLEKTGFIYWEINVSVPKYGQGPYLKGAKVYFFQAITAFFS